MPSSMLENRSLQFAAKISQGVNQSGELRTSHSKLGASPMPEVAVPTRATCYTRYRRPKIRSLICFKRRGHMPRGDS